MGLKELASARLREARRLKKWSIFQAAEAISVKPSTWGAWESGQNAIPLEMLDVAARVLGQPVEFFVVANYEYKVKASVPEETIKKARTARRGEKQGAH